MKKVLCKPCALEISRKGRAVKPLHSKTAKITCSACGRRRFGIEYDVARKINTEAQE